MKARFALLFVILSLILASLPPQTAVAATATAVPPKNFFKFPFKTNRIWRMSGGPHPENGKTGAYSSIDFKPAWHSGCSVPNNGKDYVVAAATGTVKYNDFGRSRELIEKAYRETATWLDAGHYRAAAN